MFVGRDVSLIALRQEGHVCRPIVCVIALRQEGEKHNWARLLLTKATVGC